MFKQGVIVPLKKSILITMWYYNIRASRSKRSIWIWFQRWFAQNPMWPINAHSPQLALYVLKTSTYSTTWTERLPSKLSCLGNCEKFATHQLDPWRIWIRFGRWFAQNPMWPINAHSPQLALYVLKTSTYSTSHPPSHRITHAITESVAYLTFLHVFPPKL